MKAQLNDKTAPNGQGKPQRQQNTTEHQSASGDTGGNDGPAGELGTPTATVADSPCHAGERPDEREAAKAMDGSTGADWNVGVQFSHPDRSS